MFYKDFYQSASQNIMLCTYFIFIGGLSNDVIKQKSQTIKSGFFKITND